MTSSRYWLLASLLSLCIPLPAPSPINPTLECVGCRFRSSDDGGFRRGLKIELNKMGQSTVLIAQAGTIGKNGDCKIGSYCLPWKNCRWYTYALLFNRSKKDVWFQTNRWFIPVPLRGALKPGKDGWLRIPSGRSALFLAGPYSLPCTNQRAMRELRLYSGTPKTYIGRIRWSARCSPCRYKVQDRLPLK